MLTVGVRDDLDRSNEWKAARNSLGKILHSVPNCVVGNWKFSRDGGAVGDYNLKDQDGLNNLSLPSGAIILNAFVYVKAAVTSGGLLTLDVNANAANDSLAAQAVAGLTLAALVQGVETFGTLSSAVVCTAARTPSISLNVAAATAGELDVYFHYVFRGY